MRSHEWRELERLDREVSRGLADRDIRRAGMALLEIHERGLWASGYLSMSDLCEREWSFQWRHGQWLIAWAQDLDSHEKTIPLVIGGDGGPALKVWPSEQGEV